MADNEDADASAAWLPVIGKALAYLCLQEAQRRDSAKLDTVLKQVKFLEGLGLPRKDAAEAVGSSANSVRVLHQRTKAKNGNTKKKKTRRGRRP
jgi:hypothetical protein